MNIEQFQQILTTFADTPADLDVSKGEIIVQIHDEIMGLRLFNKHSELHVEENGVVQPARQWLVTRVARLPQLADRMLAFVPEVPFFVVPGGQLLDQLENSDADEEAPVPDAALSALTVLDRRPAGTSSVLYLTSDAGEGKTTLIAHLAREQAARYKRKETDWLLLPVSLGGRTFMRFDDVVIGALVNRLRFPLLYFDAFLELVRLGVLVPALDGFEEMFVEGAAGGAVSALGNLVTSLRSEGTIMIAARKAYFEYKSLHAQAKMFDSLEGASVSFARIALSRWNKSQFLEYGAKRKFDNIEDIYDDVCEKLGADHPLLTRAVLVRRLLDVASETPSRTQLLQRIGAKPDDYFAQFVDTIVEREAHEKWIDKSGDPPHPLLSVNEHHELLAQVAQEMWTSESEIIRGDVLGFVAEIFAESKKKDRVITRQIVERIKQHALIVPADGASNSFKFDHQEFYHYYLGVSFGRSLIAFGTADVRQICAPAILPQLTLDTAAGVVTKALTTSATVVEHLSSTFVNEPAASYARDNVGAIVLRLMDHASGKQFTVTNATFAAGALTGRRITSVMFQQCYFQHSSLEHTSIINCRFDGCQFECLELSETTTVEHTALGGCKCFAVMPPESEFAVYSPQQIDQLLTGAGFILERSEALPAKRAGEPDEEFVASQRFFRLFTRASEVNEETARQRLGTRWGMFTTDVLPLLERHNIVGDALFRGSGKQRRFRLTVPLTQVVDAMSECDGRFGHFIALATRIS